MNHSDSFSVFSMCACSCSCIPNVLPTERIQRKNHHCGPLSVCNADGIPLIECHSANCFSSVSFLSLFGRALSDRRLGVVDEAREGKKEGWRELQFEANCFSSVSFLSLFGRALSDRRLGVVDEAREGKKEGWRELQFEVNFDTPWSDFYQILFLVLYVKFSL
eukprot:sb/3472679/